MVDRPQSESVYSQLKVGQEIGPSAWICVDQAMVSKFAEATLDPDPMHIDPEWAMANTPYEGTIVFGFQTLALLTAMVRDAMKIHADAHGREGGYYLNYGIDRMRLLQPLPVNSHIRGRFKVVENRIDDKERNIVKFRCEVELQHDERPVLVADWLSIFMPEQTADRARR